MRELIIPNRCDCQIVKLRGAFTLKTQMKNTNKLSISNNRGDEYSVWRG